MHLVEEFNLFRDKTVSKYNITQYHKEYDTCKMNSARLRQSYSYY